MSLPEPESPSPLDAFLEQFRKDQEAGCVRTVREYMDQFPGDDDGIGREYFALKEEKTSVSSTPRAVHVDEQFGPYRIIEVIGQGGQGRVYLAEDSNLHRKVALKVLNNIGPGSEDSVTRFRREAEVASKLDHPGICSIYEAGVEGGVPFIAMRYVEGETVARRIAAATKVTETGDSGFSIYLAETNVPGTSSSADASSSSSSTSPDRNEVTRKPERPPKLPERHSQANLFSTRKRDAISPQEHPGAGARGTCLQTGTRGAPP